MCLCKSYLLKKSVIKKRGKMWKKNYEFGVKYLMSILKLVSSIVIA